MVQNDPAAWEEFVRRFQPTVSLAVLRTCRHWTNPPKELIEDLIQETLLKLSTNNAKILREFEPEHENSLANLVWTVTCNVVNDHFRKAMTHRRGGRSTHFPIDATAEILPRQEEFGPEQRVLLGEIQKHLRECLTGPHRERDENLFWLKHRQGYTAEQIAAIPSISLTCKGVESVLKRILDQLRDRLA